MADRPWPRDAELDAAIENVVRHICDGGILTHYLETARRLTAPLGAQAQADAMDEFLAVGTAVVTHTAETALICDRVAQMARERQRQRLPVSVSA